MKKTCSGCKALELDGVCGLRHPIIISGHWPKFRYRPAEECEKPMTNRTYIELYIKLNYDPRPRLRPAQMQRVLEMTK